MRYWVYKDTQILGPYASEDLDQAGGLHPETLVCEEDSGRRDSDWKCVSDVPGLSGLRVFPAPPLAEGALSASLTEGGSIGLEALGVPSPEGPGDWISGIFEEGETRRLWGREEPSGLAARASQELSAAKESIQALSAQVQALQARLAEAEKPREAQAPPPQAALVPAEPAKPKVILDAPKSFQVASPPPAPSEESAPAPAPAEIPAVPEVSPPATGFAGKGIPFKPAAGFNIKKKEGSPRAPGLKFGETKSFPVMPQEPASLEQRAPPAPEAPAKEAPPPPAPAPVPAPVLSLEPPPRTPAPAPSTLPPMTLSFKAPVVEVFPLTPAPSVPAPAALPSELPGMSGFSPAQTPLPPMTLSFSIGSAPPGAAAAPPLESPAAEIPAPPAGPETADVLARLAKPPPPPPTVAAKPRRGPSKAFLAGSLALLAGLLGAGFFFFRNTRDLKNMVNMGSDQEPLGAEAPEEAERPLPVLKPTPAEAPQAQVPPAGTPVPEPARERAPDAGQTAIELVKGYPLEGERGSVGQWLQYSYTGNSGQDHKEEWTAGAVDATTFVVQYRLLRGRKASKEPISYVFDADIGRRTVQGKNALARDLLAGAKAPPRKTRPAKAARRRAAKRRAAAPAKKLAPLLPLPSDADLLPPPEGDARFNSDTIQ